ncbi:hypothetical protein [Tsukamurella sp. PLM1]|uniref:hypothetical protein n=1 Tax=Tsukamurella sp. PLM1 TaxID=2929795 RepID=UPI0020BD9DEA|nr:hypothetical protein [Tsukamurella sp. PLM1]
MSKRVSLILRDADEAAISPFLTAGSPAAEALRRWAAAHGAGDVKTEASRLRVLLQAGAAALQEQAVEDGYVRLAEEFNTSENDAARRAARDRYVRRREAGQ